DDGRVQADGDDRVARPGHDHPDGCVRRVRSLDPDRDQPGDPDWPGRGGWLQDRLATGVVYDRRAEEGRELQTVAEGQVYPEPGRRCGRPQHGQLEVDGRRAGVEGEAGE